MKDSNLKRFGLDGLALVRFVPRGATALAVGALIIMATVGTSHAQRFHVPIKVSSVTTNVSANRSQVTIAADSSLAKAQTWQDEEGFHVVLPNTVSSDSIKPVRGVKIRQVGSSLEILAQARAGSRVSVSSSNNQLDLLIDGKLDARPTESGFRVSSSSPEERQVFEDSQNYKPREEVQQSQPSLSSSESNAAPLTTAGTSSQTSIVQPTTSSPVTDQTSQQSENQIVAQADDTAPPPPIKVRTEEESMLFSIFSGTGVFIVFALGLIGLLVSRKMRSKPSLKEITEEDGDGKWEELVEAEQSRSAEPQSNNQSLVRAGDPSLVPKSSRQTPARVPAGPAALYGAYRIDQEVGKLTLGQPHRIDVLASRAVDDRRAIEASLIKAVNSTTLDESAQRRAREALEEYGFVARQCASLLLAPDAYERSSAAKALGEIKSAAALPFLLEGLYDAESIVRNQSVMSIGELKLPSAIGALLDIARTHPDVPNSLLSRTLSACSVEGLDFFDAIPPDSSSFGPSDVGYVIQEITHLEQSAAIESLPESSDDEAFTEALVSVNSDDQEKRAEALKTLVQFRVQSAVDAIARVARHDREGAIRSLAISSLGSISHESVFATILIGMADESREVRAAAARSVNRLNFDRADAYVRVMETSDDETLRSVAHACVQAGIVSQNLDRLTNADHRQAYETFALICLLTKAGMNEPVLDAITDHPRMEVRLKAVHLLASTGHRNVPDQLRELAVHDNIGEVVKTALLEALYRLDQTHLPTDEVIDESVVEHHSVSAVETEDSIPAQSSDFEFDMTPEFKLEMHTEADEFER